MAVRLEALERRHRARVREILDATAVFRPAEVEVALEVFDAAHAGEEYELVGAFEGDRLSGYACFGPTPGTERTWDLYWIAVDPATQGRGEGSALLREVEARLRGRGARLLVVETSSRESYRGTRGFYAARGYGEAARLRDFYALADDRVIYTKRMTPRAERES